jgi:hypothetical protein
MSLIRPRYAVSYDWSKGSQYNFQGVPKKIFIHQVEEKEIRQKVREGARRGR